MKTLLKKKVKKNNQKKKTQNNNVLINLLYNSKNLYGDLLKDTNKNILPFIYGVRHNYTILNVQNISFFLKRIFKLLEHNLKRQKKILLLGNSFDINFLIDKNFTKHNRNIIFYNEEWINGLITNKIMKNNKQKKIHRLIKNENIELIIVIKNSINDNFLNKELSTLKVPTISLINTTQSINNIQYPVVSNTKNIKSLFTLMFLFHKIFIRKRR